MTSATIAAPRRVYLQPGEVQWSREPCVYRTVLGSCVSVCLWDPEQRIGGLTHFVLPRGPSGERDGRFGAIAVPRLIDNLTALGSGHVVAKVFGGASVASFSGVGVATVGELNTRLALEILEQRRIPVVARRTGGAFGIVIEYDSASGDVLVRRLAGLSPDAPPPGRVPAWA